MWSKRQRLRKTRWCTLFAMIILSLFFISPTGSADFLSSSTEVSFSGEKCSPSLLIIILTYERHHSLERLLYSLKKASYGCSQVDLVINIDAPGPNSLTNSSSENRNRCVETAEAFDWKYGSKIVNRRIAHAGLSLSWFEVPHSHNSHEFMLIVEDDMELNPGFFLVFQQVVRQGSILSTNVTAFCLHPDDWEVNVVTNCKQTIYSNILYESPEPCNWGPIWKYEEWRSYIDWVAMMKLKNLLPLVPKELEYDFNLYLELGKDVQSSWVWRYNYEFSKRLVRYSLSKCLSLDEFYLTINHKEPGVNFKEKSWLANHPELVQEDITRLWEQIMGAKSNTPHPFHEYVKGDTALRLG
jgi:hypothetical protein